MDALLPNGPHPARLERVQSMLRARFSRSRAPPPLYALLTETKIPAFVRFRDRVFNHVPLNASLFTSSRGF